jgi:hypothetical protein
VKIQGQGDNTPKPVDIVVLSDFHSDLPGTQTWVPEA